MKVKFEKFIRCKMQLRLFSMINLSAPIQPKNERKNILIIFKFENDWNPLLKKTLEKRFNVYSIYCDTHIKEHGLENLLLHLISIIDKYNIILSIIDQEFFSLFHAGAIGILTKKTIVAPIFFDDIHNHYMNRQNSCFANFVIVGPDPLEKLRYESYGIKALNFSLENDINIPIQNRDFKRIERKIDIFFSGHNHKQGRKQYLDAIKISNFNTHIIETEIHGRLPYEAMYELMASSKIILNFSKTDHAGEFAYALGYREPAIYQFKGRIIEGGICGACVISEEMHALGVLGLKDIVPIFRNPKEMLLLLEDLIRSGDWYKLALQLNDFVKKNFSASKFLDELENLLETVNSDTERRIILGRDSNYVTNVVNRIRTFNYLNEEVRERDLVFFNNFIEDISYRRIAYSIGGIGYPYNA